MTRLGRAARTGAPARELPTRCERTSASVRERDRRAAPIDGPTSERPIRTRPNLQPRRWEKAEAAFRELLGLLGHAPGWPRSEPPTSANHGRAAKREASQFKRALGDLPSDPQERGKLRRTHGESAFPVLRELVVRAESMTAADRNDIVETWNTERFEKMWTTLPLLCESPKLKSSDMCGHPVFRRQPERNGPNLDEGPFCSDRCRRRKNARSASSRHRQKKKLEG